MTRRDLPPLMTWTLLGAMVYVAYAHTGFVPTESSLLPWAWSRDAWARGDWLRLFTSLLAHGGVIHLAVNGLALASFGPHVERALGPVRFAALFVVAGVAGNFAHVLFQGDMPVVGASGAIFGLLGVVLVLSPLAPVTVMAVIPMPILLASALYVGAVPFLMELTDVLPIAHAAHLGGFVAGLAAGVVLTPRRALRVFPAATVVFAATWFAMGYAVTVPWERVPSAPWADLARLLWPLAAAFALITLALADLGRAETEERDAGAA